MGERAGERGAYTHTFDRTEMRGLVVVTLCAAVIGASFADDAHRHHHEHRHHKAPLEMDEESEVLESLVGQEHLQIEPATTTTSLGRLRTKHGRSSTRLTARRPTSSRSTLPTPQSTTKSHQKLPTRTFRM